MENLINSNSSDQAITSLESDEISTYLKHKRTGGRNFEKGHNYENKFALLKLAEILHVYLSTGIDSSVTSQKEGYFVDDLVVEKPDNIKSYQLKNVQQLVWGAGRQGSLLFDFCYQAKTFGHPMSDITLVLSSEVLADKMRKDAYPAVSGCNVLFYPDDDLSSLVKNQLRESLTAIARSSSPTLELLDQIARIIAGNWFSLEGMATASMIADSLLSQFLRTRQSDDEAKDQLRQSTTAILDKIENFSYCIDRGYFHCTYLATKITLGFTCFSNKFQKLQDWIEETIPQEFEGALETVLTIGGADCDD